MTRFYTPPTVPDLTERPAWQQHAACRGMGPDPVLPREGRTVRRGEKAICAACPVRVECGEYGLGDREGIWGGMSHRARQQVRRERREHTTERKAS